MFSKRHHVPSALSYSSLPSGAIPSEKTQRQSASRSRSRANCKSGIATSNNVDQLLAELKEYAMEVDMDFVRKAVRAIGQVAIKIEECAEKAVNVLLELINTKVGYVVQEVVVVIKDIFRRYPGYEGIIPTLCQCIDDLDEPNARGSLIWIVGEYAEKISNAGDILAGFVEGFNEEFTQVRLHRT